LYRFRDTHPTTRATVEGIKWEYIACGQGDKALLILPGLFGVGEMSFEHILAFEDAYRLVVPTYPPTITCVPQLIRGIVASLTPSGLTAYRFWAVRTAGWWRNAWCVSIPTGLAR
jgi:hypothetical protein